MGQKASFSKTKTAQVIILHKKRFSLSKICKKVSCSKMTVHQTFTRFQNFGLYHDKKRIGRPRKTNPCDDNFIWQITVGSPSFYKKIHTALLLKDTDVHCTTLVSILYMIST